MRYIGVTVLHQPDAGQHSKKHFSYQEPLGQTDEVTAREFAFRALAEGQFHKGLIQVVFPQAASYSYRFERMGLMGFNLRPTQEHLEETRDARKPG